MHLQTLQTALNGFGLLLRGGFHPGPGEDLTLEDAPAGRPSTLVLIGNAGRRFWPAFSKQRRTEADPLDAWTRRVLNQVADGFGARPLFPFDGPPYLPFQQWALRAAAVSPSPIGPLIHPTYGLWHAYRGALLFETMIDLPALQPQASPCEKCPDKPCLSSCPAEALKAGAYDVPACLDHLESRHGESCLSGGCLARSACPVGREYAYEEAQARFHMEHFRAAQRTEQQD